jgi:hypothetical protein
VLRNTGSGFVQYATAAGGQTLAVEEPFAVRLRPADLGG